MYEHLSGGGCAGGELPDWGLTEGYAMLKAFLEDFKRAGCRVSTLLDWRLKGVSLEADEVKLVKPGLQVEELVEAQASKADISLIIAPEVGGVLARLVGIAEKACSTLNCSPAFFQKFPGKAEILQALKSRGIKIPETGVFDFQSRKLKAWGRFPAVVKPSLGAGCLGVSRVETPSQLEQAASKAWQASLSKIVVQEFLEGIHASLSLLACEGRILPLSVNLQLIGFHHSGSLEYEGGLTPLPLKRNLPPELLEALASLPGLKGLIGVDFILTPKFEPWIVEVNPRPTTSYLGLRKTLKVNPVQILLEACSGDISPRLRMEGFAAYLKGVPAGGVEVYQPRGREALTVLWRENLQNLLEEAGRMEGKGPEVLASMRGQLLALAEA